MNRYWKATDNRSCSEPEQGVQQVLANLHENEYATQSLQKHYRIMDFFFHIVGLLLCTCELNKKECYSKWVTHNRN